MKLLAALLLLALPLAAQDLAGDLSLHRLLLPGEEWQVAAEGLGFSDGACTDREGNFVFADLRGAAPGVYRLTPEGVKTKLSDEACSGLKFGPDGRLYGCQGSKKRLIAIDLATGAVEVLVESVQPNDLVVTKQGYIYFTDTGNSEVIFVDAKTKATHVADHGITGPNGIAISPDGSTLAVSDYKGAYTWLFRLQPDGTLDAKMPALTMRRPVDSKAETARNQPPPYKEASGGDGMCTDALGRYFITSAVGLQVFDPGGRLCGVLPKPNPEKSLTNCAIAGPAGDLLYVTNGDKIFRRKVLVK